MDERQCPDCGVQMVKTAVTAEGIGSTLKPTGKVLVVYWSALASDIRPHSTRSFVRSVA